MLLQEAIKLRILELADERGYSVNKLAERSGIAPSVLKKTVAVKTALHFQQPQPLPKDFCLPAF